MQGPLEKISAGSLQGSSHKDLYKIFAQGSLDKDLYKIFPQGSPLWRSCNDPLNGFLQDISTRIFVQRSLEHLRARISTRSSTRSSSQGSPSALFARTCTRSCKDLLKGFQLHLCKVSREIFCLRLSNYIPCQTCCPIVLKEGERIHHGRDQGPEY